MTYHGLAHLFPLDLRSMFLCAHLEKIGNSENRAFHAHLSLSVLFRCLM